MTTPANPRIRLGRGRVTPNDTATWEARRAFLRAVSRVSPETYWSLFPSEPTDAAFDAWRDRWNDDVGAMIADWQDRWNLTDPWCADVAVNTLRARLRWHVRGCTAFWNQDAFVTPKARSGASGRILALPVAELYLNQETETRKETLSRLAALIEAEYDRVEAEAIEPKTGERRAAHFEWLARHQVLVDESIKSIAASVGHDRTQVGRAIDETAALIGLTPREPNRGGRPRRKTSRTAKPMRFR